MLSSTLRDFILTSWLDIEVVGMELIEDNIVSVSRQMIDKEASVPSAQVETNGNGAHNGDGMAVDQDEDL